MMKKILVLGLYLFCGWVFTCVAGDAPPPSPVGLAQKDIIGDGFIELDDCGLVPGEATALFSNIKVAAAISCEENRMVIVPQGANVVLFAEGPMELKRMHFYVEPGARLTLVAGSTITLERVEEGMEFPVVTVEGELYFFARSRDPSRIRIDEVPVPQGQQNLLITEGFAAAIYSEDEIKFTANAIVVGAVTDDTSEVMQAQAHTLANEIQRIEATENDGDMQRGENDSIDVTTNRDMEKEGGEEEALLSSTANTIECAEFTMGDDEMAVDEHADTPDADMTAHRLKVGEVLRDESLQLTLNGRGFKLWSDKHGSLLFKEYLALKLRKEDDEASTQMEPIIVIPASKSRVKSALKFRSIVEGEMAGGGNGKDRKTKSGRAWTPWGIRYNRRLENARKHVGEVDVTVSNKGCVEVSVDGFCVLSRSGPYTVEWINKFSAWGRKRSSEYELHVVEDGMEVKLGARKIWGARVP